MPPQTQGELFPEPPQVADPEGDGSDLAPVWLQRLSLGVLVVFCFYIGGLLTLLPWSPRYWSANAWILNHPSAAHILLQGWVRGLVSGIGLMDLWIGVSELLHYRDARH